MEGVVGAGRVADTVRATGVAPPAVEEALAVVAVLVVTRYAFVTGSMFTYRV